MLRRSRDCVPGSFAIVVTAALGQLPPPLIEQLKVGGRLVMPVGPTYTTQHLTVVEKIALGKTTTPVSPLLSRGVNPVFSALQIPAAP
jgi:protein-L-isoaspartate O-methyltransferase